MTVRICFVCSGNICRSPMAEVVLRHQASALGLAERLAVDSAGTAADVGFDIDRRARRALEGRGYTLLRHRGRQFEPAWLSERDLVIAMEQSHLRWLESRAPKSAHTARVRLLLSYPTGGARHGGSLDIPDPYFGDEAEFESCLDLVQAGCTALLGELTAELAAS
ncbi:MAG: low molecular weight protein-tyrosine-phosphatase [Acidimicrobiales bacterium]